MFGIDHPVVLFDGVCNLCSSSVQFVIKHDPKNNSGLLLCKAILDSM